MFCFLVRGLMEEIKNVVDADKQSEMEDKFKQGVFTLRDMYEQFQVSLNRDFFHKLPKR